jgi:hypothetical protein
VRARLARLLQNGDGERLPSLFVLQLRQPQRRGEPGRPAANDQDVNLERLSGHGGYFCSSAIIAGTISNRSPTMP